jgi:hypothetical protein
LSKRFLDALSARFCTRSGSREVYAIAVPCQCENSPFFRRKRTLVDVLHVRETKRRKMPLYGTNERIVVVPRLLPEAPICAECVDDRARHSMQMRSSCRIGNGTSER